MSSPALILVQPMQSLPSLFALSDQRARCGVALARAAGRPEALERILALDPLTVLRAMRFVCAPMHGIVTPPATVRELIEAAGAKATHRLLAVPEVDPLRTRRIRLLWHRAVARACAAERLAAASGIASPDESYLAALVRDLDAWMRHLGLHHNGMVPSWRGSDLVRHWGLGLGSGHRAGTPVEWQGGGPVETVRARPDRLLDTADALAVAAGFSHPDETDAVVDASAPGVREAAEHLRAEVEQRFEQLGAATGPVPFSLDNPLSPAPEEDRRSMVPRLLDCRSAPTYSSLTSLVATAAWRYLDFDRAFVVGWNPDACRTWIRAKADLSSLPIVERRVRPTEREADALASARASGEPQMLVRGGASQGLCGHLGTDRAMVLPLNPEQRSPSFLVLDRATSSRPIDLERDSAEARNLGGFLTLLLDNLGLRLRRRRAQRNATIDSLTGLANRGVGIFTLERAIAAAKRSHDALCVMMLDLDDFKQLNDRFGHIVGDQALRMAANVFRRTVRSADIVCRYGGEEFLVTLPKTHPDEATILATRLFTEVAEAGRRSRLPLTVSIGLSSLRLNDDLDSLVGRADRALYASKERGRNRFSVDTD